MTHPDAALVAVASPRAVRARRRRARGPERVWVERQRRRAAGGDSVSDSFDDAALHRRPRRSRRLPGQGRRARRRRRRLPGVEAARASGIGVTQYSRARDATSTRELPHPFFDNQFRARRAARPARRAARRARTSWSRGCCRSSRMRPDHPARRSVGAAASSQTLVTDVQFSETYPYDTADVHRRDDDGRSDTRDRLQRGRGSRSGCSQRNVGAGGLVRFTRRDASGRRRQRPNRCRVDAGGVQQVGGRHAIRVLRCRACSRSPRSRQRVLTRRAAHSRRAGGHLRRRRGGGRRAARGAGGRQHHEGLPGRRASPATGSIAAGGLLGGYGGSEGLKRALLGGRRASTVAGRADPRVRSETLTFSVSKSRDPGNADATMATSKVTVHPSAGAGGRAARGRAGARRAVPPRRARRVRGAVRGARGAAVQPGVRMLGNPADAEDLLQEIFLSAHRKLDSFAGESALGTWLYRLAMNQMPGLRPQPRGADGQLTDGAGRRVGAGRRGRAPAGRPRDRRGSTSSARSRELPEGCRAAFVLHDVEGLEHGKSPRCSASRKARRSRRCTRRGCGCAALLRAESRSTATG